LPERPAERPAGTVFELMNGFTQRPLEITDRDGLIEQRRIFSARAAFMSGAMAQCLGRFEGSAAARANTSLNLGKIGPAASTEMGNAGVIDG
jgi:hypothetical protein